MDILFCHMLFHKKVHLFSTSDVEDNFAELHVYTNKPTHHYKFSLFSSFFQAIERSQRINKLSSSFYIE